MRGIAPGPATITVTADRVEATVEITVVPDPERVALSAPNSRTEEMSRSEDDDWLTGAPDGGATDDPDRVVALKPDTDEFPRRIPPERGARVSLTGPAD